MELGYPALALTDHDNLCGAMELAPGGESARKRKGFKCRAMLVGYLIGLSHIDPLQFKLSLEGFLPDDDMASVPDIDLDFPRNIREELIKRVHEKYGWERAALTGMISTYKLKGAVGNVHSVS